MVSAEKDFDSNGSITKKGPNVVDLDERRRAALAEIDNAQFSYVSLGSSLES